MLKCCKDEELAEPIAALINMSLQAGKVPNQLKKSDKVATQLKARGDLISLGFDWFNFIRYWFRFRIGSSLK